MLGNYPNPFNPSTVIRFQVAEDRKQVSIEIFNIRGQRIRELVSGVWDQGFHSVEWNGEDSNGRKVSSGIYFFRFVTDDAVEMKKMLLLK